MRGAWRNRGVAQLGLAATALLAFGCVNIDVPRLDNGVVVVPPLDAGPDPRGDDDGDGLCNGTEGRFRTDPTRADSDGDGLWDRLEIELGFSALRADSPAREQIAMLIDEPGEETRVPLVLVVDGELNNYAGAYQSLFLDGDPESSDEFFGEVVPVIGLPRENVFEIDPELGRFLGVDGETQLTWEFVFRVPEGRDTVGCARGIPFRLTVEEENGPTLLTRSYVLVRLARGETLFDANWCPFDRCV